LAANVFHDEVRQSVAGRSAVEETGNVRVLERSKNLPFVAEMSQDGICVRAALDHLYDNVMIGGFIVGGNAANVLVRATGPSLIPFGISNALADPRLELHDGNGTLAGNDDWQVTQTGGIITSDQSGAIQNSGLAPGNPAESAILATLPPGSYTAVAQGVNGGTGVGIIEVFALP
jgi:hypothetical protein